MEIFAFEIIRGSEPGREGESAGLGKRMHRGLALGEGTRASGGGQEDGAQHRGLVPRKAPTAEWWPAGTRLGALVAYTAEAGRGERRAGTLGCVPPALPSLLGSPSLSATSAARPVAGAGGAGASRTRGLLKGASLGTHQTRALGVSVTLSTKRL